MHGLEGRVHHELTDEDLHLNIDAMAVARSQEHGHSGVCYFFRVASLNKWPIEDESHIIFVEEGILQQGYVDLTVALRKADDISTGEKHLVHRFLNGLGKSPCQHVGQLVLEEGFKVVHDDLDGFGQVRFSVEFGVKGGNVDHNIWKVHLEDAINIMRVQTQENVTVVYTDGADALVFKPLGLGGDWELHLEVQTDVVNFQGQMLTVGGDVQLGSLFVKVELDEFLVVQAEVRGHESA